MRRRHAALALAGVGLASSAILSLPTAWAESTDQVMVVAQGDDGDVVGADQIAVTGEPAVADVVSIDGGQITVAPGPSNALPKAFRFPAYTDAATYPRAVLRLTGDDAAVQPGDDDVSWGAVFELDDSVSSRTDDNGNNVLQRGLASQPAQFKLDVDKGYASCWARGDEGRVIAHSSRDLQPDTWYHAWCTRSGDTVTVKVRTYGVDDTVTDASSGPIGALTFDDDIAASVGGKVARDGDILASASDQFNGLIARARVVVTRP